MRPKNACLSTRATFHLVLTLLKSATIRYPPAPCGGARLRRCSPHVVICLSCPVSCSLFTVYQRARRLTKQPGGGGVPQIPGCSGPPQDSHGDATARPEWLERPPRLLEEAPKRASRGQDGPRWLQDDPRWPQDGPRCPQDAPRGLQEASQEGL